MATMSIMRSLFRARTEYSSAEELEDDGQVIVVTPTGGRVVDRRKESIASEGSAEGDAHPTLTSSSSPPDTPLRSPVTTSTSPTTTPRQHHKFLTKGFAGVPLPWDSSSSSASASSPSPSYSSSPKASTFLRRFTSNNNNNNHNSSSSSSDRAHHNKVDASPGTELRQAHESHVADIDEFDKCLARLKALERPATDPAFDAQFWSHIRSILVKASHPIGVSSEATPPPPPTPTGETPPLPVSPQQSQALIQRLSKLQSLMPIHAAKLCHLSSHTPPSPPSPPFGKVLDERTVLTELLYGSRAGLLQILWMPKCQECASPMCLCPQLGALPATVTCPVCATSTPVELLDRVAVAFAFTASVLHVPTEQFYRTMGDISTNDFSPGIFTLQAAVPSTSTAAIFRYAATGLANTQDKDDNDEYPAIPAGRYHLHFLPSRKRHVLVVERDAVEEDSPVILRPKKPQDWHASEETPEIVVPHGRVYLDLETDARMVHVACLVPQDKEEAFQHEWHKHSIRVGQAPFTTATTVLHHEAFQRLFSNDQVVSANPEVTLSMGQVVLVFTDVVGSTDMYNSLGDGQALSVVRKHYEILFAAFTQRGRVVKTVGDAVMASFTTGRAALEAVSQALEALPLECLKADGTPLRIRVGIHAGPSVVVPLNGINDYFGQTVNMAARVEAAAQADECLVTEAVLQSDPDAAAALEEIVSRRRSGGASSFYPVASQELNLKGIEQPVKVKGFRCVWKGGAVVVKGHL